MVAISNSRRQLERDHAPPTVDYEAQRQINDLRGRMTSLERRLSDALELLKAQRTAAREAEVAALAITKERTVALMLERTDSKKIIQAVAAVWGVSAGDLVSPRRGRDVAYPRHAGFLLCKRYCDHMSLPMIGRAFGNRGHTTVMHGLVNAERLLKESPIFAGKFAKAESLLGGGNG
jgi:chromosomal replication initiation ATPase DnaA